MKLLRVIPSPNPEKKYRAIFQSETGREKSTDFGARGYTDFIKSGDVEKRERYRTRHAKDLETGDPTRAGHLSYYLLWGQSRSMATNLRAYKSKFNL